MPLGYRKTSLAASQVLVPVELVATGEGPGADEPAGAAAGDIGGAAGVVSALELFQHSVGGE